MHIWPLSANRFPWKNDPRKDWRGPMLEKVELAGNRNRDKAAASVCVEDDAACRHYWKGAAGVARGGRTVKPRKVNVQNMIWLP